MERVVSILIKIAITLLEYVFIVALAYVFDSSALGFFGGAIVALRAFNRFSWYTNEK